MSEDEPLRTELAVLLNRYSRENRSDTPDFILAMLLLDVLKAFENATVRRDKWYGHEGLNARIDSALSEPDEEEAR